MKRKYKSKSKSKTNPPLKKINQGDIYWSPVETDYKIKISPINELISFYIPQEIQVPTPWSKKNKESSNCFSHNLKKSYIYLKKKYKKYKFVTFLSGSLYNELSIFHIYEKDAQNLSSSSSSSSRSSRSSRSSISDSGDSSGSTSSDYFTRTGSDTKVRKFFYESYLNQNVMIRRLQDPHIKLIIGLFSTLFTGGGHMNLLIINKVNKTVELYDPNGADYSDDICEEIIEELLK